MNDWSIHFRNEWVKLTRNPQVVWILMISGWTLVGLAWILREGTVNSNHQHVYDDSFFAFFSIIQLISLPIISLTFFTIIYTERQNQTASWLYRLPVRAVQWHIVKFLTAWLLCVLTLFTGLTLAGFIMYWSIADVITGLTMSQFFGQLMAISVHLLLLTIPMWLTYFALSFFIRTPTIAVLVLLVLQVLTAFGNAFPNPLATLRLAIAHASAKGHIWYQPERIQLQYLTAGVYILLVTLAIWLYSRWRSNGLIHNLIN
ncbi:ABC transporter permease [Spirosoma linguale]|uniref:Uncharacterized protein n=1 Tax=Spirosoma linguale (strain ATCC 33905 / DSM 74 / LMG 10896 / Claus 1) TaxID=504472 RepID=D2QRX7_SPILD|nr:hypothetical protein Slin_5594 [Spirosoma linguale DSM 74]